MVSSFSVGRLFIVTAWWDAKVTGGREAATAISDLTRDKETTLIAIGLNYLSKSQFKLLSGLPTPELES